ncbi:integral component of membrane [Pyrenophora seminiperda CCB06]|uniref:Integral component of membrane n=1 Tax=Pyrenophora seminiperda CCB06 TaxID=1302712 RepID=A0A3M7M4P5_9PLEO|nr:integral component of membrane [Pyrenophora seminiperda CCB06]
MAPLSYSLKRLFTLSLLGTSTLAQNATNTTDPSCSRYSGNELPVNSSGTINTSDVYVSVTFGEISVSAGGKVSPWIYTYISTPENSTKQICATTFGSALNKKQGDSANGCGGVLSPSCIDALKNQLKLPTNNVNGIQSAFKCPNFSSADSAIKSACSQTSITTSSTVISTSKPNSPTYLPPTTSLLSKSPNPPIPATSLNTTNTTCASTSPPQDINWNLPSGYRTRQLYGVGPDQYDAGGADNFHQYDNYVTSPVPIVIASFDGSETDTQVVCVAPRNVVQGSRVPDEKDDGGGNDKNAGASVDWRGTIVTTVVMAGVAATSLLLL